MKRTAKYVGLDVHQATTVVSVRDPGGRVIAHSILHTTNVLRLSEDLPMVIEIVEAEERMSMLEPILDEMVHEGLVTIEKVRVLKYAAKLKN